MPPTTAAPNATALNLADIPTPDDYVGENAAMLIGSMAFVMVIFYLVNCRSELVSSTTWTMVNLAVSIFCAVLWYDGFNKVFNLIFEIEDTDDSGDPPGTSRIALRGFMLVAWWYFLLLVFFLCRNSALKLKGYSTVGGHILGFAAIYFFGDIALSEWFRTSCWKVWLVILLNFVVFAVLLGSSIIVKKCIQASDCADDEEIDRWHDTTTDTKNDWMSMASAFLIVFFLRWWVVGEPVSIDGELGGDPHEAGVLLGLGLLFLFLAGVLAVAHHMIPNQLLDYVNSTVATSAAFLLIFGLMWKIGGNGSSELSGQVYVAVTLSCVAMVFVLGLAMLKHVNFHIKAARAALLAVALAVGLSWEKVFDAAMDAVGDMVSKETVPPDEKKSELVQIFFTFFYLFVVFPAWMLYILPKTDADIQKKMKRALSEGPLPCRAICCDEDLYDDFDDLEDDAEEFEEEYTAMTPSS